MIAEHLSALEESDQLTWLPMPPSKCKSDPHYDVRMIQILKKAHSLNQAIRYEDVLAFKESHQASHQRGDRTVIDELMTIKPIHDPRQGIVIIDDIITSGRHFRKAKALVRTQFPDIPIFGVFVARRVLAPTPQ